MMTVFAGCSSLGETAQTGNSNVPSSGMQEHEPLNYIVLTDEIIKLTDGFSAVRYSGDYGFDLFLDQGGASLFGRTLIGTPAMVIQSQPENGYNRYAAS